MTEKYYTTKSILQHIISLIEEYQWFDQCDLFVDFSSGNGAFAKLIREKLNIATEEYDIDPSDDNDLIIKQDWFTVLQIKNAKKIAIGLNPPFGYKCGLANQFVDHALSFSPFILILIVPHPFNLSTNLYEEIYTENLPETSFYDPETDEPFYFSTKLVVYRKQETPTIKKHDINSKAKKDARFTVRVNGKITGDIQLLVRRAGVNCNEQFYMIHKNGIDFWDRGKKYKNTDWKYNNHSVEEGGNPDDYHGSSNRKMNVNKPSKSVGKTGWSWYKIGFTSPLSKKQLISLVKFIYNNQAESKLRLSKDIRILSKSSPPSINTKYLIPIISKWFDMMEYTTPCPPPYSSYHSSNYSLPKEETAPSANMSQLNNQSNPCFHGDCMVQVDEGSYTILDQLQKGDKVMTPSGKYARIVCVIKTVHEGATVPMVVIPGLIPDVGNLPLIITPYHPIRIDGQWKFPTDVAQTKDMLVNEVYNFILDSEHIMIVNGIECVTLGHDFKEPVVQHDYFGSDLILKDVEKMVGWEEGLIKLKTGCIVRDDQNHLVTRIIQE